jgi:hypothetical protein
VVKVLKMLNFWGTGRSNIFVDLGKGRLKSLKSLNFWGAGKSRFFTFTGTALTP